MIKSTSGPSMSYDIFNKYQSMAFMIYRLKKYVVGQNTKTYENEVLPVHYST